jgi:hypothetical protein
MALLAKARSSLKRRAESQPTEGTGFAALLRLEGNMVLPKRLLILNALHGVVSESTELLLKVTALSVSSLSYHK